MTHSTRHFVLSLLAGGVTLLLITIVVLAGFHLLEDRYAQQITALLVMQMSEEDKKRHYDGIEGIQGTMWDTVPEPLVGRIGQAGKTVTHKQAEVRFNNAGLRSSSPFGRKPPGVFRVVCLGDSFVFGEAGLEENRFCDQMESFYRENDISVDGKAIETLALGLGSWTLLQEATYMSSRISAYDPDVIVMLASSNDITPSSGVTGKGTLTLQFSPQVRSHGSGLISQEAPHALGHPVKGLLASDLSPLSSDMWAQAMSALRRLAELQQARGAHIVYSVLERNQRFRDTFLKKFYLANIDAPVFSTSYFFSPQTRLPHDGHPNRKGHEILAAHFVNILHQLGWVPATTLPELDKRLSMQVNPPFSDDLIQAGKRQIIKRQLSSAIDFPDLTANTARAVLGGLMAEEHGEQKMVWSSVRSAFLLSLPEEFSALYLELEVPAKPELHPFEFSVRMNGAQIYNGMLPAGRQTVTMPLPDTPAAPGVAEVLMETPRYFTGITDHRMKSFILHGARLE